MYLILNYKKMPPKEWCHDPRLMNKDGKTVALMIAAFLKSAPPDEWYHDPNIKSLDDDKPVEAYLLDCKCVYYKDFWKANDNLIVAKKYTMKKYKENLEK